MDQLKSPLDQETALPSGVQCGHRLFDDRPTVKDYLNSMSTPSYFVLPTFLMECVTGSERQRTLPIGRLTRSGCSLPLVVTSNSAAVSAIATRGTACVCIGPDCPGSRLTRKTRIRSFSITGSRPVSLVKVAPAGGFNNSIVKL